MKIDMVRRSLNFGKGKKFIDPSWSRDQAGGATLGSSLRQLEVQGKRSMRRRLTRYDCL